ncbi:unnamed protein product [Phyllotreta striolata]|uniref:Uncharacterized protein n=1 Tax=Phyllotreta striolata TaxID=444603 RepID=A0A9N9XIR8_PHYSR|nr:unnamed protein product [Phyllotreta striolata]
MERNSARAEAHTARPPPVEVAAAAPASASPAAGQSVVSLLQPPASDRRREALFARRAFSLSPGKRSRSIRKTEIVRRQVLPGVFVPSALQRRCKDFFSK